MEQPTHQSRLPEQASLLLLPEEQRSALFLQMVDQLRQTLALPAAVVPTEQPLLPQRHKPVAELVELYLAAKHSTATNKPERGKWSATTFQTNSSYLRRWSKWMNDRLISKENLELYWSTLDKKERPSRHYGQKTNAAALDPDQRSDESKRNHQREIRNCCAWLVSNAHIEDNPFVGKDRVELTPLTRQHRVIWSHDDVVRMLACEESPTWKRNRRTVRKQWHSNGPLQREAFQARVLLLALLDSAARATEMCRLNCGHVREQEAVVRLKGAHQGVLFFSRETRAFLQAVAGGRSDEEPLFLDWRGNRCSKNSLLRIIRNLAERAEVKIPADPLHSLRHFAARYWSQKKIPDLAIQSLMRHANLATSQIYTRQAQEETARLHQENSPAADFIQRASLSLPGSL